MEWKGYGNNMLTEYVTALFISYSILVGGEPQKVVSTIWFENEDDCQHAFQHEEVADILYDHIRREYGNSIMMGCEPTQIKTVYSYVPPPRPKVLEE
jgi:hypothetical protein